MRARVFIAVLIGYLGERALSASGFSRDKKPLSLSYWLEGSRNLDRLPRLRGGTVTYMRSSACRLGTNSDYLYFLRRHQGRRVIVDAKGPGVITRFWTANAYPISRVLFFLDGADKPQIDLPMNRLFDGSVYPFLPPLCVSESTFVKDGKKRSPVGLRSPAPQGSIR